jgi:hypothetical protein
MIRNTDVIYWSPTEIINLKVSRTLHDVLKFRINATLFLSFDSLSHLILLLTVVYNMITHCYFVEICQ